MASLRIIALLCAMGSASAAGMPDPILRELSSPSPTPEPVPTPSTPHPPAQVPVPAPVPAPAPAPVQAAAVQAAPAQAAPLQAAPAQAVPATSALSSALPAMQPALQRPLPGMQAPPSIETLTNDFHKLEGKEKKMYDKLEGNGKKVFDQIAGKIRGEAEKIKSEGEQVYHKFEGQVKGEAEKIKGEGKQVYQKIDKLPVEQKAGVAVGAAVGVAAVAGAIGSIAEAAHEADTRATEASAAVASAASASATVETEPAVVKVFVPVEVPVTTTARYFFTWPRLYESGDAKPALSMAQGSLMGAAIFVFFGCTFLGLSVVIYLKRRSQTRSLSRVASEDAPAITMVDDDEPLLA